MDKFIVDIWGSCVSREILNYSNLISCGKYILQNPIHTLRFEPYIIKPEEIVDDSSFIQRMTLFEMQKKAIKYFNEEFKSNWLIVDTADCRSNIAVLNRGHSGIAIFVSTNKVLKNLRNQGVEYTVKNVFDISQNEWKNYVESHCELLLTKYREDHIIINKFKYATKYFCDGNVSYFAELDRIKKENELTRNIEELYEEFLPYSRKILPVDEPIADRKHRLGCSPLHFSDLVYRAQAKKLEYVLGLSNCSPSIVDKEYNTSMGGSNTKFAE